MMLKLVAIRRLQLFPVLRLFLFLALLLTSFTDSEAANPDTSAVASLKRLSLEQLLDVEVTLVSKTPEKLSEVPSAIQVLTAEDIRRSGATRLPEALRLATNLMVAQVNSHDWAVTSRGFNGAPLSNNTLADKLLVMIDGRTVYSPLFGGVFWEVQSVMLEDIERIEIVSGPGGTLWGANAVNGVINIVTKSSEETKGFYASGAAGNYVKTIAGLRYGGTLGPKMSYRLYGRYADYAGTESAAGTPDNDPWHLGQGGFRLDYKPSAKNNFMLSGDYYSGKEGDIDTPQATGDIKTTKVNGQYLLGRWIHQFTGSSSFRGQVYFDRTWRDFTQSGFTADIRTYDIDLQHGFSFRRRHKILWGLAYRIIEDDNHNVPALTFFPEDRTMQLFDGFLQDQISIVPSRLDLTLGTKILYNNYSHTDYQPSARLAYRPTSRHTVWAAVSRAVRTPTRFDVDVITPSQSFASEKQVAYELGYRGEFSRKVSFSLAAFYSDYKDLRSINSNPNQPPVYIFANNQEGHSAGLEFSGNYWISNRWRLRAGYTLFDKTITATDNAVVNGSTDFVGVDPRHQALLQSIIDLPYGFETDCVLRYVSLLYQTVFTPEVPSYVGLDVRIAKRMKWFELSVVGQNLLQAEHAEFGSLQIPRSVYVRLSYRLIK
jgi:iron complex outermembrane receptor protein